MQPLGQMQVLLADPDSGSRAMLTRLLSNSGCLITAIGSEDEALDSLEQLNPELVIVAAHGAQTPDLGLIKLLRFAGLGESPLRVLVLLDHEGEATRTALEEAQVDAWLRRPFEPAGLIRAVAALADPQRRPHHP